MKKHVFLVLGFAASLSVMTSCTTMSRTMKEPTSNVEFHKQDFTLSGQVTGSGTETRILGVDWERLFSSKNADDYAPSQALNPFGMIFNVPVIGAYLPKKNRADGYALYDLYNANPGYDVVFYPAFERKRFMIPIFYTRTEVKVTARLGKLTP